MMVQQLLIGLVFLGALAFLASLVVRSLRAKEGCDSGCGKCDVNVSGPSPLKPKP